jgi:hypothetical protein
MIDKEQKKIALIGTGKAADTYIEWSRCTSYDVFTTAGTGQYREQNVQAISSLNVDDYSQVIIASQYLDDIVQYWLQLDNSTDNPLFSAQNYAIDDCSYFGLANTEAFLQARFGSDWQAKPVSILSEDRAIGSMQLFKDGVMFDFIMHYVRGEKTYWFEPAANVISTKGFLPCSMQSTTAGDMLLPDHPEVFLEEHYPNWRVPVKTWNGAVDNPTIILSDEAMWEILNEYASG